MTRTLILTFMGTDRPGLVAELAACVADHGGNWVESRLVHFGGQFAGVLRLEVPKKNADSLAAALGELEKTGLRFLSREEDTPVQEEAQLRMVRVELIGSDRPGILKAVSQALARHAVNIEELSTERRAAPMSGEALFQVRGLVHLPPGASLPPLRADLEKITADLMVDLLLGESTAPA